MTRRRYRPTSTEIMINRMVAGTAGALLLIVLVVYALT